MNLKKRLAHEIVRQFHGKQAADEAEEYFQEKFQKRELHKMEATAIIGLKVSGEAIIRRDMPRWLVNNKFANSMSEAKRLLAQGAVRIIRADGTTQVVSDETVEFKPGDKIKVGKLRFAKIIDAGKEKA
jgi:tyrosyl-tRNA synthetase